MPSDTSSTANGTPGASDVLSLPQVLDLTVVHALKENLLDRVTNAPSLVIDASEVEKIGSAAIQLLHAASVSMQGQGKPVSVKEPSSAFVQGFKDIGFGADLENWSVI